MAKVNKGRWLELSKSLAYALRSNKEGMTIDQFKKTKNLSQWIIDLEAWQIASFAVYDKQCDGTNRFHLYVWTLHGKKQCTNKEEFPNLPSLVNKVYMIAEPSIKQKKQWYKYNEWYNYNNYYNWDNRYYTKYENNNWTKKQNANDLYDSFDDWVAARVAAIPTRDIPSSFDKWVETRFKSNDTESHIQSHADDM